MSTTQTLSLTPERGIDRLHDELVSGIRLPRAWRYVEDGVMHCCAWCDGKAEADALAVARGLSVTHGICSSCSEALKDSPMSPVPTEAELDEMERLDRLTKRRYAGTPHEL